MNERIMLYSASLYDVSEKEGCTAEVYESLVSAGDILRQNKEYVKIMNSSALDFGEREELLNKAFEGNVHPFVLNFMKILAKKRIFDIFLPCAESFEKMYFKDNNIEKCRIITAVSRDDDKKEQIVKKISAAAGKKIIPEFIVDENIIGGIVIETESSAVDASVRGRLEAIKRYISKN